MTHSITFWWISTSFKFWRTTLVVIPSLTYQWSRENFATEATTKKGYTFRLEYWAKGILKTWSTKILKKRDIDDLINQEVQWSYAISGSFLSGMCFLCIKFFKVWIISFTLIESFSKRMMGLGLGLGWGCLDLGFVNNYFIIIVACWMKCCCIRTRDFCLQQILLLLIKLL